VRRNRCRSPCWLPVRVLALRAVNTAAEQLGRSPLFRGFTATGLQILASIARERHLQPGTPIFREESAADAMYVVVEGAVRIGMTGSDGREQTLAMLGAGEAFGELSLVTPGAERLVFAQAQDEVRLLEIQQRDFARLQTQKPQACLKLILNIAGEFGRKMAENRPLLRSLLLPAARR